MKKTRWMAAGLLVMLPWTGMTADHVYFQDNRNLPMIVNTEGIYATGNSGVFMDLSSIELTDIFKNGMEVKAEFLHVKNGAPRVFTEYFRLADDGRAWVQAENGWHSVTSDSSGAERIAVSLIREDMGNEEKRMTYTSKITAIWDAKVKAYELKKAAEEKARREKMTEEEIAAEEKKEKKEDYQGVKLDEVEPETAEKKNARRTPGDNSFANQEEVPVVTPEAVKTKGQVQKEKTTVEEKKDKPEQVEIVIISDPTVEIIPSNVEIV